ncbi:SusC/RagA family TonB-linked outer membrane protein [Chitinophaga pendula]|uniref:SusC/RagA family TonB-linked outer membrane protein n=1 Tax=Chitinophaga TaxID=79328 RepID=UPI0012FE2114|nr:MULTISPECIES: SusC/RagA family TonB-linked outer membrane protein [Chitinophaga]UCJ07090.1 SusC/RagA family TonB-linked outer membrane protein [Chitinophaga pendula]
MRSHVLTWLGVCCALYCTTVSNKAFASTDYSLHLPSLHDAPVGLNAETASYAAFFQQKDTTVKPGTPTPVVVKPASKDTSTKPQQSTQPAIQPTTTPVVITPAKKDTGTKPADTTKPASQPTAAPVTITPAKKDTSAKPADTTKPAGQPAATPVTITPGKKDTTGQPAQDPSRPKSQTDSTSTAKPDSTAARPKQDTGLILPPDSATLRKEIGKFTLRGTVLDANNSPIPGATVQNKTTKQGIQADTAGNFSIKAGVNDTLLVAAPTFGEQAIPVKDREPVKVNLTATNATKKQLNEVVVTALGIQKNTRSVGYAISDIRGSAVQEAKEVNFVNALSGKVPGLQVNTNTGSMGGSSKVTIRGTKSILGDNNAFIVVDGVPIINNSTNTFDQQRGGGGYDFGSPLQDLNPEDMENISVLKGAGATALYGSRGSNGVLLITTKKRPESEKGLGITYSLNAQMDQVYVLPKYQNGYGGGSNGKFDTLYYNQHPEGFLNEQSATYDDNNGKGRYDLMPQYYSDESWGPKLDGRQVRHYWSWDKNKNNPYFGQTAPWSPQPNNVKDFYRTGFTLTNNISLSGSNEKGAFRLSYGNMKQEFVISNAELTRNNLSVNGNYQLHKKLTAVASVNYSILKANARPGTGFTGPNPALQFSMFGQRQLDDEMQRRFAYPDGSQITWNRKSWNDPAVNFHNGSYWNRYRDYETDSRTRLFGYGGLDYEVTDWLNLSGRVFMDQYNTLEEERNAKDYLVGSYIKRVRDSRELNYQFTANINKKFSEAFSLNATVGGNVMHRKWSTTGGSTVGGLIVPNVYNLANSVQTALPIDEYFEKQINSVFATATLGYRDMLFLELTGRNDKSSTLNDSYFYPSASGSFVFSELLKDWKWLEFGKIRASIAAVGSDTDPYRQFDTYSILPPFTTNPILQPLTIKNNPNLKPERTKEYEIGTELKFLDNRIGVDVTYYNRTTTDQILTLSLPSSTGYTTAVVNGGSVRNQGFEFGLNLNPIRLKNGFRWDINGNLAINRNKLLNMDIPQFGESLSQQILATDRRTAKVSIAAITGSGLGAIMGTDYVYDGSGNRVVDQNGFYKVSAPHIIGNVNPDFFGGVTNSFTYKGVYLSALVDFQKGGDFFSYTNLYGKKSGMFAETAENGIRENGIIVPGVTEDGKPNEKRITAKDHFNQNGGNVISKADLYDASYIYLREVKLGYNLPDAWFKRIGAQNARISLYGRNLWLIKSNAPNVDPSNITNSSSNIQGVEGGALPSLRSYGVNLNISF